MFWAQTDTALLVLALVVIAERIASSFSRRFIKPASRKHAPRRFYAHHRGTGSGILDRSAALVTLSRKISVRVSELVGRSRIYSASNQQEEDFVGRKCCTTWQSWCKRHRI
jgi:hypothetical protein